MINKNPLKKTKRTPKCPALDFPFDRYRKVKDSPLEAKIRCVDDLLFRHFIWKKIAEVTGGDNKALHPAIGATDQPIRLFKFNRRRALRAGLLNLE